MNKLIIILLILAMAGCTGTSQKPLLYVPQPTVGLGNVPFDSSYHIRYKLINRGGKTLMVDTVTASCGCSIPEHTRYTIPPMDSAELVVYFKPPETGDFDKKIVIKSNTDSMFTIVSFNGIAQK